MKRDSQIFDLIAAERSRQMHGIELIASENFVSEQVMEAMGSVLTNKYAEGYPGKRYYGGCEVVDKVETLAIERICRLYGAEYANVQPHSGSQANMAAYFSVMKPGDTLLGMNLSDGGHLTHGSPVNFSGRFFHVESYGIAKETGRIDYDEVEQKAMECHPQVIMAGASAYPRVIDFKRFREIADKVGAKLFVDMAHIAGLVATGVHPSPVPYAHIVTTTTHKTLRGPRGGIILCKEEYAKAIDKGIFPGTQGGPLMHTIAAKAACFHEALQPEFKAYQQQVVKNAAVLADSLQKAGLRIVSGGTDNHLMLVDLTASGRTGKEVEHLLDAANITVNKNTIPGETLSPMITSGVRVGTPAVTTRGMVESDMEQIAGFIRRVLEGGENACPGVKSDVMEMMKRFPLYEGFPNA